MWVTTNFDGDFLISSAHQSFSIIATANIEGIISTFDEEFNLLQTITVKKDSLISYLKWHPTRKFLAMGFANGTVAIWSPDTDSSLREGNSHFASISTFEWSPSGNRLITGDKEGGVVVWKIDSRGKLTTLSKYRLQASIDHIQFKNQVKKARDTRIKRDECLHFYIGDISGRIFLADDLGHCSECFNLGMKINSMYINETKDLLVVLTQDLMLSRLEQTMDRKLKLQESWLQIKLGSSNASTRISSEWLDGETLAFCTFPHPPKVWNSISEETTVLERPELSGMSYKHIVYSKRNNILATSSDTGHIVLWQKVLIGSSSKWEPLHKIEVGLQVFQIFWGIGDRNLFLLGKNGIQKIAELQLLSVSRNGSRALQIGQKKVVIENKIKLSSAHLETKSTIKGLQITECFLHSWNGTAIDVYNIEFEIPDHVQTVACSKDTFSSCGQYLFVAKANVLTGYKLIDKETTHLQLPHTDGDIISVAASDTKVYLFTNELILKIFDVIHRDYKLLGTYTLSDFFQDSNQVFSMKPNFNSTNIAITNSNQPSILKIFSLENHSILYYECSAKVRDYFWDKEDHRFLLCSIKSAEVGKDSQLISLFVTPNKLICKDIQHFPEDADGLVDLSLPFMTFSQKFDFNSQKTSFFMDKIIKDYEGIDPSDGHIVKTVTEFCYNLAVGDLDKVVKLVKLIKNDSVWINLASLSIKMRRLKLAKMCLGKLRNAKSLRTIQTIPSQSNQNLLAAQYAVQIGLYEEAKQIWNETNNFYDMNKFFQASGAWEQAINTSATKDRSSLPITYYNFASELKEKGDYTGAIAAFEKSNASKSEIPRMMLQDEMKLKTYIESSTDKDTKKWWAQNAESHGDFEVAIQQYQDIGDVFSLVRIYCQNGDIAKALELAGTNVGNLGAQYLVARYFESDGKWNDAIAYYSKAKCFSNAIKIAKQHKFDKELLQLALQSSPPHMCDVAKYFESLNINEKAIMLYSKAGKSKKALELCFKTENTYMLESIMSQIDPKADSLLFQQASNYLSERGSHESALKLLISAKKFDELVVICDKDNLKITDSLMEQIQAEPDIPKSIYLRLADLCLNNQLYQHACKCFALGGDRLKAMSALLKSGDKDKIITFASNIFIKIDVSRHPDIYTIAANYLQTLNWMNDGIIMRTVIQFYTKAKAYSSLSRFYETCSQIEVDEFQNYEKALAALSEAEKVLSKDPNASVESLKYKQKVISLFLDAHHYAQERNVEQCESICAELLNQNDIDAIIRIGDIFGLLIETNFKCGDKEKAANLMERLKMRLSQNMTIAYYVNEEICKALLPDEEVSEVIQE